MREPLAGVRGGFTHKWVPGERTDGLCEGLTLSKCVCPVDGFQAGFITSDLFIVAEICDILTFQRDTRHERDSGTCGKRHLLSC